MTSYLDALPRGASAPTGSGLPSYTDSLGSASSFSSQSFQQSSSPFSPAFGLGNAASVGPGRFEVQIEANENIMAQLEAAQGGRVTMYGRASFN